MNKSVALTLYLALSAVIAAALIWGVVSAGYPLWAALVFAFLLFAFLNGTLAYKLRARHLRTEGKEPPPYLQYLFFPTGVPRLRGSAPRSMHGLVGIAAVLTGAFFCFCGTALAVDAEWSRVSQPMIVATICLVLVGIGAAFLYLAWRLFLEAAQ